MIKEEIVYACRKCDSPNLVRNGTTKGGQQKFLCRSCGASGTLAPAPKYDQAIQDGALAMVQERSSFAGIQRALGPERRTVLRWIKKNSAT